jgi:hypothetical protein
MQGYLFSAAKPAAQIRELLSSHRGRRAAAPRRRPPAAKTA